MMTPYDDIGWERVINRWICTGKEPLELRGVTIVAGLYIGAQSRKIGI